MIIAALHPSSKEERLRAKIRQGFGEHFREGVPPILSYLRDPYLKEKRAAQEEVQRLEVTGYSTKGAYNFPIHERWVGYG